MLYIHTYSHTCIYHIHIIYSIYKGFLVEYGPVPATNPPHQGSLLQRVGVWPSTSNQPSTPRFPAANGGSMAQHQQPTLHTKVPCCKGWEYGPAPATNPPHQGSLLQRVGVWLSTSNQPPHTKVPCCKGWEYGSAPATSPPPTPIQMAGVCHIHLESFSPFYSNPGC